MFRENQKNSSTADQVLPPPTGLKRRQHHLCGFLQAVERILKFQKLVGSRPTEMKLWFPRSRPCYKLLPGGFRVEPFERRVRPRREAANQSTRPVGVCRAETPARRWRKTSMSSFVCSPSLYKPIKIVCILPQ